jgi:EmrB/QacA subfamily drug resistance transporter
MLTQNGNMEGAQRDTVSTEALPAHLDLSEHALAPRRENWWLNEFKRPEAIRTHASASWLAVGAVCIGAFMGQLDASIVTLALPTLQHSFHASLGAVTWVGLSYLLVLVASVAAVGRMSDMVGRKLLYVYGFLVFIAGSALCGFAPSLGALYGFRAIQAVGAAMLQANSLAIIVLAVPVRSLGRAIGIQGAAQALGLALGPTVGGLLLVAGGWRLIFLINVPVGIVGVVVGALCIPRSRNLSARTPFDWTGLGLLFPCVVTLLSAVSFGNAVGWLSPLILGLLIAAVMLAVLFIGRERHTASPMVDLRLFSRPAFTLGISSGLLAYLVLFGVLFVVPFYLERGLGFGAGRTGLQIMAMPVALGLTAPLAGRLADRLGPRPLTVSGMAMVAGSLFALAMLPSPTALFVTELALIGIGLGLFTPPNNASIMATVPPEQSGMASGVLNMTRGMGTAMGLAFAGMMFGLAGGDAVPAAPEVVHHAFAVTAVFLGAIAVVAGILAGARPGSANRRRASITRVMAE